MTVKRITLNLGIKQIWVKGVVILPFLDLNRNGRHDSGEPKAFGLNLRINGGRIERNYRDTTLRITRLEANTNYWRFSWFY